MLKGNNIKVNYFKISHKKQKISKTPSKTLIKKKALVKGKN